MPNQSVKQTIVLSHVAVLVHSVEKSRKFLVQHDFFIGSKEQWPGEGTLEIYIGEKNANALLLLMEPLKDGAYKNAMLKRGPGLHHIAIDVINLEAFIDDLSDSGWLLHPKSFQTFKKTQTVYLARPGIPTLIEAQQISHNNIPKQPFISKLEVPVNEKDQRLLIALGIPEMILPSMDNHFWVTMNMKRFNLEQIIGS